MPKIDGGYILLSKKIVDNEIMQKPPEYLKTWIFLLSNANYKDDMPKKNLKKGQGFININELREFLSYYVGFRLEKPSRKKVWAIVEWLRNPNEGNNERDNEGTMIETMKVTHGMVYTVLNYAFYQNPKNYERNDEGTMKETTNAQRKEQEGNNKYNESKESKRINELKEKEYSDFVGWFKDNFKGNKTKKVRDNKLEGIIEEQGIEHLKRATERYMDECNRLDRFVMNEGTWWNGRYIDYLDDEFEYLESKKETTKEEPKKQEFIYSFDVTDPKNQT